MCPPYFANSILFVNYQFRFLRERSDKKAEQATTSEQIVDMYFSQGESNGEVNNGIDDDDELI